ncbi:hypothetical protein [Bythopirellula polymerisocia]|uniref:hypothetical protein n=1 Tax=Bythopirellula polymerisocia TaxID=2528003 RepID=UPI0011B4A42E|nr:hypothetical protein [Bythopirellula polymerisocia]
MIPVQVEMVSAEETEERNIFEVLLRSEWTCAFFDSSCDDWKLRWFLDGEKAEVTNDVEGITIDATDGYAVLWTKASFEGDLRIEYDFKRIDSHNIGVNIVYIQATGDGQNGHAVDISKWSDRRTKAAMSDYFLNMNTYHISYAAYPNDYIRGRRYLPLKNEGLKGTELSGEIEGTRVFENHEWIHITIIKRYKDLFIEFRHPSKVLLCHFVNQDKPGIDQGHVGLRLMPGRISRFKNFRISKSSN